MELKKTRRKLKLIRQDTNKEIGMEKKWRKPKGMHSKLRLNKKGHGRKPSPGYRAPREIRGKKEYSLVNSIKDIGENRKIIIASNVGGLPELVLNKKMVFESGNREELSDKIALAFNKTGLLASLAADSSTLMGKYSWGNISAATLNVYNELVAQK